MTIAWLALGSVFSWFLSTVTGGGSPLILIPLVGTFLGAAAVPPVLTVGLLLGNGQRVGLYWPHICWQLTGWYAPGAIVGAFGGAFIFTQIEVSWLPFILALLLLASTLTYPRNPQKTFGVKPWYFLPGGLVYSFISGLAGSTGPLLNPLYLNYGLVKESLIATKALHMILIHCVKLATYLYFGAFDQSHLIYGLLIGGAALPGNFLGKRMLDYLSDRQFRQLLLGVILASGGLMLWEQKDLFPFW